MRIACWMTKATGAHTYARTHIRTHTHTHAHTHTHTHNAYRFSAATVVTRSRPNSNFYAHWLSCCSLFVAGTPGKNGTVASAGVCCLCGVGITQPVNTHRTNE